MSTLIEPPAWKRATTEGFRAIRRIPMQATLSDQDRAEAAAVSDVIAAASRVGLKVRRHQVRTMSGPEPLTYDGNDWALWRITATYIHQAPEHVQLTCIGGPADGATMTTHPSRAGAPVLAHRSKGRTRVVIDPAAVPYGGPSTWDLHPYECVGIDPDTNQAVYLHAEDDRGPDCD